MYTFEKQRSIEREGERQELCVCYVNSVEIFQPTVTCNDLILLELGPISVLGVKWIENASNDVLERKDCVNNHLVGVLVRE